ncbi:MAG: DNA adenine methylase [Bacteroidales bacterium]|nr:DNA adenine methylase [Bacteroidales bacterium]
MFNSPLRYPGGKNKLSAFIAQLCVDNNINWHYIEPYAGGASVALFLLLENYVNRITINDKDRSIYAFWYSVLNNTNQLCELIENTNITIEEWKNQKKIQEKKDHIGYLELGFSTLFLNRTNRSGIIRAGAIGGINQTGNYLIDCRFNKKEIIRRIKIIANEKDRIQLLNKDAIDLIEIIENKEKSDNIIFYFDPPYYVKGNSLYMNHYNNDDHLLVSNRIKKIKNIKWIVSYDNIQEIKKLYEGYNNKEYTFKHTAYESRAGKEILFFSSDVRLPNIKNWNPLNFKFIKKDNRKQINYVDSETNSVN